MDIILPYLQKISSKPTQQTTKEAHQLTLVESLADRVVEIKSNDKVETTLAKERLDSSKALDHQMILDKTDKNHNRSSR